MRKLTTLMILPFVITACGNIDKDNARNSSGLEHGETSCQTTSGGTTEPTDPTGPVEPDPTDPTDPYDACAELACGDPCDPCDGNDPECLGIGATTFCNATGECVAGNPMTIVCEPEWDPCAELACGDACEICDPADPDCFAIGATSLCDGTGECVVGNPQTVTCG